MRSVTSRGSGRRVLSWLLAGVVGMNLALIASPPAAADVGLGGGTEFLTGSTFPFVAGEAGRIETAMYVQNIGADVAEVELQAGLPTGVELEPLDESPMLLNPGQMRTYPFAINVSEAVAPGLYDVIVTIAQTNVQPEEGSEGSVYRPAVAGNFVIEVVGESSTVTVKPISDATGLPARGQIGLFYLTGQSGPLLIDSVEGTELTRDVVPGRYLATFDVPGLQRQEVDFEVGEDEQRTIELEIPTLSFTYVGAQPSVDADGDVITAELVVAVNNSLRRIQGPVRFEVEVARGAELVETITLSTLAELPPGITEQRVSYRPLEGFAGGNWQFRFFVANPDFRIEAPDRPSIDVPGIVQSNWEYFALGVATLLVIALAMPRRWWFVLLRRRKKDEKEHEEVATRAGV